MQIIIFKISDITFIYSDSLVAEIIFKKYKSLICYIFYNKLYLAVTATPKKSSELNISVKIEPKLEDGSVQSVAPDFS